MWVWDQVGVENLCHSLFQQRARVWVERSGRGKTISFKKKSESTSKGTSKIQNGLRSLEWNSLIIRSTPFILP